MIKVYKVRLRANDDFIYVLARGARDIFNISFEYYTFDISEEDIVSIELICDEVITRE